MKRNKIVTAVICVVAALLISMIGCSFVLTNGWSVKRTTTTCTLEQLTNQIAKNNAATGRNLGKTLTKPSTAQICLTTYVPKNATAKNPAPCIIGAHGWNNSKEMQLSNIVELTKRGFVVVVVDLAGHGRSDAAAVDESGWGKGNTECTLAATEYAMSLNYVDVNHVGVTGHSAGNLALAYTISQINAKGSKKHISSFFCPAGTMAALTLSKVPGLSNKFLLGVAAGKYDELDTHFFGTYDAANSMFCKMIFNAFAPKAVTTGPIPLGQYYNATGKIASAAPGKKLSADSGIVMYNPHFTHVGGVFSTTATKLMIDFFYSAYGTPVGAKYIASNSQTWPIAVVFQTLGLLAFFASAIVFGAALLKRKKFADLNRKVLVGDELPSIKSWKEWVPVVVTFVPLAIFAYTMYFKCFDAAPQIIKSNSFPDTVNGMAWYTLASGFFAFIMIGVNYITRKLCYLKDDVQIHSLLETGKVDSVGHFMKTLLYCVEVIVLMYIANIIAYFVFGVNFGFSVYVVGVPRLIWLPEILTKYLPMWLMFLLPNAMLNAKTRFKEVPEWASTLFCVLANALPIMILTYVNYRCLITTGATRYTFGDPSIMAFNLFAPMIFIGITGRYFYKKTNTAWAGAIINATILTLMATTLTRHISDFAFFL